jgi:hypothetical protein
MTVEHVMTDRQTEYVRWRAVGIFTGAAYQGIEPTDSRVDIRGADAFIELEDGLIRRNPIFYDGAAFARAVGLLPARGSRLERLILLAFNFKTRLKGAASRLFRPRTASA